MYYICNARFKNKLSTNIKYHNVMNERGNFFLFSLELLEIAVRMLFSLAQIQETARKLAILHNNSISPCYITSHDFFRLGINLL
jgi:hypothetical protein